MTIKYYMQYLGVITCILMFILDIYGKCRTMNPSTNTSTTSTGNIQGWSQNKQTKTFEVVG
jgi:hypothetical protein